MFLLHIWGFSCFTHCLQKDAVKGGRGGVSSKAYRCVQEGACNGVWVHTQFDYLSSVNFFSLGSVQILQTLEVKIYTNKFQELYRSCIRLQVFITLYQSSSGLWESLKFVLDFDNSRIGVQFRNKLTSCKVNIGLQTILSLRLCITPYHDYCYFVESKNCIAKYTLLIRSFLRNRLVTTVLC